MALAHVPPVALMRTGDPQDPRAQRTRTALLAELGRQLQQDGPPPSVSSVIRGAAVSRSAFYAHFASLEVLHAAAVREVLDAFGATRAADHDAGAEAVPGGSPDESYTWLPLEALLEHVAAHRHLFVSTIAGGDAAVDQLQRALVEQCRRVIEHAPDRPVEVDAARAASFVAGGLMACVVSWLAGPPEVPASQLAHEVSALVPTWLVDGLGVQAAVAPVAGPAHGQG